MLVERIYKHYEQENRQTRSHLGASELGSECERKLWLNFRWHYDADFSGRMLRLFETGSLAEQRFIDNLYSIGVTVKALDEVTGSQHRVSALSGHFGGSLDAVAYNIDPEDPSRLYILEFKTHNDKSFTSLQKQGVAESHYQHYAQLQIYMGLSGIEQSVCHAENKNTDELYEEIVYLNKDVFDTLMAKARRVIQSQTPPAKINDNPAYFKCKMCPAFDVCHGGKQPNKNCRTCKHSEPTSNGLWMCRKKNQTLTVQDQQAGCEQHEYI